LLFEPTVAYSLLPSRLAMMFLVQWWFIGRPAASRHLLRRVGDAVSPSLYGKRTMPSALATYSVRPPAPCRRANAGLEEDGTHFGHAVAVGVAQQRDAVGARHAGARRFITFFMTSP
jgi:hypothetical protein